MQNILNLPLSFDNLNKKASKQIAQSSFNLFLTKFQRKLNKQKILKNLISLQEKTKINLQNIGLNKSITKKMRQKLLNWLQKLCIETYEFKIKTFILCIKILDSYLSKTNQPTNLLQLIGCTCLYLASKIYEPTIVAAESYITASCNIFCKSQLFDKQKDILKVLEYDLSYPCLIRVYQIVMKQFKDELNLNLLQNHSLIKIQINNLMIEITKNLQFNIFKQYEIIIVIIFMFYNRKSVLDHTSILKMLKLHFSH